MAEESMGSPEGREATGSEAFSVVVVEDIGAGVGDAGAVGDELGPMVGQL